MSFLYLEAAKLVKGVRQGKGSLKGLALAGNAGRGRESAGDDRGSSKFKKTYLLASETLRFSPVLRDLLAGEVSSSTSKALKKDISNVYLRDVMLYELLMGAGKISGGGRLKRAIMGQAEELMEGLVRLKAQKGLKADDAAELLLPVESRRFAFPRYVRINRLKISVDKAMQYLTERGIEPSRDEHIPDLLVCPPETKLHDCSHVLDGSFVLQDKSSCFSAQALAEAWGGALGKEDDGDVLDACAAPGNKTTHLLSLMGTQSSHPSNAPKNRVWAMEKNSRRLALLRKRCQAAASSEGEGVLCEGGDFLEVDPSDSKWSRIHSILLDPSCSGSGIVSTPERLGDVENEEKKSERIELLADFQKRALLKALSFPQVKKVVYSTCSTHEAENEEVVAASLSNSNGEFSLEPCLKKWHRRGRTTAGLSKEQADCLVRVDPEFDHTNGFFVALFVRKEL